MKPTASGTRPAADGTRLTAVAAIAAALLAATLFAALLAELSTPAAAYNDPGHDNLYILKLGDSNLTGSLNISANLTAQLVQATTRFFGPNLDIRGDGSSSGAINRIVATATDLEIGSDGTIYLAKSGGMTVAIGSASTPGVLNVSGTIYQNSVKVCLANGTNCVAGNNTGNVSSVAESGSSPLSISPTTGNVLISMSQAGSGSDGWLSSTNWNTFNNKAATGSSAACAYGVANITLSASGVPTVTCAAQQSGSSSGAGWTNTSTTTSTSLDVNVDSGTLFANSTSNNVSIGGTGGSAKLEITAGNGGGDALALRLLRSSGYGSTDFQQYYTVGGNNPYGTYFKVGATELLRLEKDASGGAARTIFANGNVGIGTAAPNATLHVVSSNAAGALLVQNTSGSQHLFVNGSSGAVSMMGPLGITNTYSASSNGLSVVTNTNITTSSGTTSYYGAINGQAQLQILTGISDVEEVSGLHTWMFRNVGAGNLDNGTLAGSSFIAGIYTQYGHLNSVAGNLPKTPVAYGIRVLPYALSGNITNMYDLMLSTGAYTAGVVQNHWAVYQADSTVPNYFAGNVGIGTTTPGQSLTVSGTANVTGATYLGNSKCPSGQYLTSDPTTGLLICSTPAGAGNVSGSGSANYVATWTGASTLGTGILWQNATNVGIGTTSPSAMLNVNSVSAGAATILASYNSNVYSKMTNDGNGGFLDVGRNGAGNYVGMRLYTAGSLDWVSGAYAGTPSGGFSFYNTGIGNVLTLTSSGGVGIGTTSPGALLDVAKSSSTTSIGSNVVLRLSNPNSVNGGVGSGLAFSRANSAGTMFNQAVIDTTDLADFTAGSEAGYLRFSTMRSGTLTEAMRIMPNGNVGIGTTAPNATLTIATTGGGSNALAIVNSTGSNILSVNGTNGDIFLGGYNVRQSAILSSYYDDSAVRINPLVTVTGSTGSLYAINSYMNTNATANNAGMYVGIQGGAGTLAGNSYNYTGSLRGSRIFAQHNGAGTVANAMGLYGFVSNAGSGVITNAYGSYVQIFSSGGTITNTYGYYAGDLTVGTQTNTPYSFYASDPNTYNYFAGNVGIGTTQPNNTLTVVGDINASGNVYDNANRVCTAANGLCGGSSSGAGWTNTSTQTSTSLSVLINSSAASGSFLVQNTTGSPLLFVNGSSGSVGIGTTTPSMAFAVEGTSPIAGVGIGVTAYGLGVASGGPVLAFFGARGTQSTPTALAAGDRSGLIVFTGHNGNGTYKALGSIEAWTAENFNATENGGYLIFTTTNIGGTSRTEKMRITDAGNVGIGTNAPTSKLYVYGPSTVPTLTHGSNASLVIDREGQTDLVFSIDPNPPFTASIQHRHATLDGYSYPIALNPLGGNVGIGTASPNSTLHVVGTANVTGALYLPNSACSAGQYLTTSGGAVSCATPSAATPTLSAVLVAGNSAGSTGINMNSQLITDIGNAGTDFTSGGGLNLAGTLAVAGAGPHTIAGSLNVASNGLFANGTNVGIGTASPLGILHVRQGSAGSVTPHINGNTAVIESSYSNGISILTPDASTGILMFGSPSSNRGAEMSWQYTGNLMSIGTRNTGGQINLMSGNGASAVRIDGSGNVGIGTTGPDTKFQVSFNDNDRFAVYSPGNNILALQTLLDGQAFGTYGTYGGDSANILTLQPMVGNVGIGTTAPTQKLDVNGNVNVDGTLYASNVGWMSADAVFGQPSFPLNELTDILFRAYERFTVTTSPNLGSAISNAFDGNFDTSATMTAGTTNTINISLANKDGIPASGITYPQGYIYVSFYYTYNNFTSISLAVKENGAWYSAGTPTNITTVAGERVMRFTVPGTNYLTDIQLNVTTNAVDNVWLTAINYVPSRPLPTEEQQPYVSKYATTNTLVGSINLLDTNGATNFHLSNSGNSYLASTGGNVGIGTAAPNATLHIVSSNSGELLILQDPAASRPTLFINSSGSPNPNTALDLAAMEVRPYISATATNAAGINLEPYVQSTGTGIIGVGNRPNIAPAASGLTIFGAQYIPKLYAVSGTSYSVTNYDGLFLRLDADTGYTGTITNANTLLIASPSKGGSTITNAYGVYINDITAGSTSNYGLYSAGTTNYNYFAGNVGIGTASPAGLLQVVDPSYAKAIIFGDDPNNANNNQKGMRIVPYSDGNLYLDFKTVAGGTVFFRTGQGTELGAARTWMAVNSTNGNVGIGTTSPVQKLQIGDNSIAALGLRIAASGVNWDQTTDASGNLNIGNGNGNYLTFIKNSVYSSFAGNVGIGTTSPSQALTVVGDINTTGNLYIHGNVTGYDLAEFVSGDGPLEAGDVVEIDPTRIETVRKSSVAYSTRVAGVVSTDPGLKMNREKDDNVSGRVPLTLTGRVPLKVSAENGPVEPGDLLTTSSTPGYAMRCASRQECQGAIVAKAMGELKEGTGTITGLVMLG